MGTDSNYYKEIISKLERLTRKEYTFFASLGIQASVLTGIAIFVLFAFLEMLFHFSSAVRTVLVLFFLVITIGALGYLFIFPLLKYFNIFRKTDHFKTAGKVGNNFPEVKDDLLNAMQLISSRDQGTLYSSSMINAAFNQVYKKTINIRFESIVSFKKVKELFLYLSAGIIFAFIILSYVPGVSAASGRLINFNREYIPPQKFYFEVHPGDAKITKGDDIRISIKVTGPVPKETDIAIKYEDETDFRYQKILTDSTGRYNFDIHAAHLSFKYYAQAENLKSETYSIDVIDPPIIKTLDITITPPSYSKLPQIVQRDNGNITSLAGSYVDLSLTSTKELKGAKLQFADTTVFDMSVNNEKAQGKVRIKGDNTYRILLTDLNGNTNQSPITYTIKALSDAYPTIEVIRPNEDGLLSNDSRLPILLKISDDYGFTKLLINYRLSSSKFSKTQEGFSSIEIPINKNEKESDVSYIWNLTKLNLASDDIVTYYFEVFDNDNVSGPKSAKSPAFNIRVPSLDEILKRADNTHQESVDDLKQTLKDASELKKELEKIDQDLKQDKKELTWQEKEKIQNALDKFKAMQSKVAETSKQMNKMQQELQQNNLLSKETLQKYMELQKLMDELTSDEMKKAMEKLQNALKSMDRQQTQQVMKDVKIDEEQFQKSIERTMNLIKRLQIEEKMNELVKRAENLEKKQNDLQNDTKNSNMNDKNQKDELSKKQDEVTKDLDKMKQEMENIAEKMKEFKDMPKDKMDKLQDEFDKQENQELSEESKQNMEQNQKQQSMSKQSQISKNMKQMKQQMEQMQQAMQQENQMQTYTDMMRILENMITLSKEEEVLKKASEQMDQNSTLFNENGEKQGSVKRSLDKITQQLGELAQKTFAITPEMGKALGDADRSMLQSIDNLEKRNSNMSSKMQENAMASINEAANLMKGSMESMMKGGGQGGGMMSLMQQLQQMSGQQMGLNNLTQQLQQMMQGEGKLTPQQQSELQRLGQQQELIKKSLDQLNQEAKLSGESKRLPSNLDNISKQMQEIVTDMNSAKLDQDLVQKQERILSRLLDAQRSINERDYEKQRESKPGNTIVRESPADLNLSSEKGKNKIKDELNRAVQEGYKKDYEELIRKYYESLQGRNIKN
ncbi:MAG: hypothetical protein P4L27_14755 [Ignavibacteriaceae bacterium]|nr:hypothetical protein [Ignavibacteriaceae bacterium]